MMTRCRLFFRGHPAFFLHKMVTSPDIPVLRINGNIKTVTGSAVTKAAAAMAGRCTIEPIKATPAITAISAVTTKKNYNRTTT